MDTRENLLGRGTVTVPLHQMQGPAQLTGFIAAQSREARDRWTFNKTIKVDGGRNLKKIILTQIERFF
jgi:hypothetical protein